MKKIWMTSMLLISVAMLAACEKDNFITEQFTSPDPVFFGECDYQVSGKLLGVNHKSVTQYLLTAAAAESSLQQDLNTFADPKKGGRAVPVKRSSVFPLFRANDGSIYYGYQIVFDCKYGNLKSKVKWSTPYDTLTTAFNALPALEAEVDTWNVKRLNSFVRSIGLNDDSFASTVMYLEVNPNP